MALEFEVKIQVTLDSTVIHLSTMVGFFQFHVCESLVSLESLVGIKETDAVDYTRSEGSSRITLAQKALLALHSLRRLF